MIEINLLPEELRKVEGPISGTRIVFFLGVPVLVVLLIFLGWIHFMVKVQAEEALKKTKDREKDLSDQADKVKVIEEAVKSMKKKGETVKKDEPILTIHAEKEWKLTNAINSAKKDLPIIVEGMLLETI